MNTQNNDTIPTWLRLVFLFILIVLLFVISITANTREYLVYILNRVHELGWIGILIYMGIFTVGTVFFFPGSVLKLAGGLFFGVFRGLIIVSISATLGATFAFLVGRYIAREWVEKKVKDNATLNAIDRAIGEEGRNIVGLVRLTPLIPFNLINYVFGVTRISLGQYVKSTWIGMLPKIFMYVYIGSLAGSLSTLRENNLREQPFQWVLYSVGLIVTIVVIIQLTRIAHRTLKNIISLRQEDCSGECRSKKASG